MSQESSYEGIVIDLKKETEPIRLQHQRMFKRNLKIWLIRWTIGFSATAWFTMKYPKHLWLWYFAIGTALFSLVVMYIGNRLISRRFKQFDQKLNVMENVEKREDVLDESEKSDGQNISE
jgi:hypothetical protein